MLEIEIKYRADDLAALEKRLAAFGAQRVGQRDDADAYFNAPHRDFAQTDEALRVRHIGVKNFVTYKGPRIDPLTKTRSEIEVPLADGPEADGAFQQILGRLGFRPVAIVRKRRTVYQFNRDGFHVEACLDDVEQVGRFVELEVVADEAQLARARSLILRCADELGLTSSERRSYLEILLEASGRP